MKRFVIPVLATMIFGVLGGVAAGRPQARSWELTQPYGPGPSSVGADTDAPGVILGEVNFDPGRAKTMRLAIEDAYAPATLAVVRQADVILATVCTSSDQPITLRSGETVDVFLVAGTCNNAPSIVTEGLVRAKFATR